MLRAKERGARTDQGAGKRKEHQSQLTKRMNVEARVSGGGGSARGHVCVEEGRGGGVGGLVTRRMD